MSAHYRARIPFGVPHVLSGAIVPHATQLRHDRAGRLLLPVVVGARRDVAGRAISATVTGKGLDLVVDLGASAGRQLDCTGGGHYLEPLLAGGRLVAVEVTAIASWDCAELIPTTTAAAASSSPHAPAPIGPRPPVDLRPLPPIR